MKARTLMTKLEAEHPAGMSSKELLLANTDLLPVTDDKKTWDHMAFVGVSPAASLTL